MHTWEGFLYLYTTAERNLVKAQFLGSISTATTSIDFPVWKRKEVLVVLGSRAHIHGPNLLSSLGLVFGIKLRLCQIHTVTSILDLLALSDPWDIFKQNLTGPLTLHYVESWRYKRDIFSGTSFLSGLSVEEGDICWHQSLSLCVDPGGVGC